MVQHFLARWLHLYLLNTLLILLHLLEALPAVDVQTSMQGDNHGTGPSARRKRPMISCTECHRRKQKVRMHEVDWHTGLMS